MIPELGNLSIVPALPQFPLSAAEPVYSQVGLGSPKQVADSDLKEQGVASPRPGACAPVAICSPGLVALAPTGTDSLRMVPTQAAARPAAATIADVLLPPAAIAADIDTMEQDP